MKAMPSAPLSKQEILLSEKTVRREGLTVQYRLLAEVQDMELCFFVTARLGEELGRVACGSDSVTARRFYLQTVRGFVTPIVLHEIWEDFCFV